MIKRKTNTIIGALSFIINGAVFTLLDAKTKKHATFTTKWERNDLRDLIPVRIKLKGNSFQKMGTVDEYGKFRPFTFVEGTFEHRIFKLFWEGLIKAHVPTHIELWYPCKCTKCGRLLTDPASIALGIGPGCIEAWKIEDNLISQLAGR